MSQETKLNYSIEELDDGDSVQIYESISANFRHFDEMYVKTSSIFGGFFAIYIGFVSSISKNGDNFGPSITLSATLVVSIMSVAMCLIMLRNRQWLSLYQDQMEKIEVRMGIVQNVGFFPTSIILMIANIVLAISSILATIYFL